MTRPELALPDGSVLLHIGPHKTGTTTVQGAMHASRESLKAYGVHYAGEKAHSMAAAMAASTGHHLPTTTQGTGDDKWRALVEEVRTENARISVLSSEFYSETPPDRIPTLLADLGGDNVHVVITLRPLVRILGSQWQQYMQNRRSLAYDDDLGYAGWLDQILNHADTTDQTPSFWHRHRHDELVQRWVDAIGADRITVVAVDDRDHSGIVNAFAQLLGVEPGTITSPQLGANRSLTWPEIELLVAFNREFLSRDWSATDYTRFVRFGSVRFLQERRPEPGELKLTTPQWAVDRAAELGASMVERIRTTGVGVIGDLDILGDPALAKDVGDLPADVAVPADVVARLAAGLVKIAAETPARKAPADRRIGDLEAGLRHRLVAER